MKILKQYTNTTSTPSLDQFIDEKIGSIEKFLSAWDKDEDSVQGRVELEKTTNHHQRGEVFRAEVNLDIVSIGKMLRAEHVDEDAYVAIDKVRQILAREIDKLKDQLKPGG